MNQLNITNLQAKVNALEERLRKLEHIISQSGFLEDQNLMNVLCEKAEYLVNKEGKSSVIFLQRKLLIDYDRAKRIRELLCSKGVI